MTDVNWELITEETPWVSEYLSNEKSIWNLDGKLVEKETMNEDEEYIIF